MSYITNNNKGRFKTAQDIRSFLQSYGFTPLIKIRDNEYWIREYRLVVLSWFGEIPSNCEAKEVTINGATIIKNDDMYILSLH